MDEVPGGAGGAGEADDSVDADHEAVFEKAIRSACPQARVLAEAFHQHYEKLAPTFGYETREESKTTWEDVPLNNKALMCFTAQAVIEEFGLEAMIPVPDAGA